MKFRPTEKPGTVILYTRITRQLRYDLTQLAIDNNLMLDEVVQQLLDMTVKEVRNST